MTAVETKVDPLFELAPITEEAGVALLARALELTAGFAVILCRAHPSQ